MVQSVVEVVRFYRNLLNLGEKSMKLAKIWLDLTISDHDLAGSDRNLYVIDPVK